MTKQTLPIGYDDFRKLREQNKYYIDKSLMIRDFMVYNDEVALITRPRRFGKTLNMTMLRDFFDIRQNSQDIFQGLAIMETEYAKDLNSKPVIYFTFKDCEAQNKEELTYRVCEILLPEYEKYYEEAQKVKS